MCLTKGEIKALKDWIEARYNIHELDSWLEEVEQNYNLTPDLRSALKKLGLKLK